MPDFASGILAVAVAVGGNEIVVVGNTAIFGDESLAEGTVVESGTGALATCSGALLGPVKLMASAVLGVGVMGRMSGSAVGAALSFGADVVDAEEAGAMSTADIG